MSKPSSPESDVVFVDPAPLGASRHSGPSRLGPPSRARLRKIFSVTPIFGVDYTLEEQNGADEIHMIQCMMQCDRVCDWRVDSCPKKQLKPTHILYGTGVYTFFAVAYVLFHVILNLVHRRQLRIFMELVNGLL